MELVIPINGVEKEKEKLLLSFKLLKSDKVNFIPEKWQSELHPKYHCAEVIVELGECQEMKNICLCSNV